MNRIIILTELWSVCLVFQDVSVTYFVYKFNILIYYINTITSIVRNTHYVFKMGKYHRGQLLSSFRIIVVVTWSMIIAHALKTVKTSGIHLHPSRKTFDYRVRKKIIKPCASVKHGTTHILLDECTQILCVCFYKYVVLYRRCSDVWNTNTTQHARKWIITI